MSNLKPREAKENILEDLLQMGLSAPQIQEAYERYVWHYNFYEPKVMELEKQLQELKELQESLKTGRTISLPCNIGDTVYVSPNHGKSFHKAILLGVKFNENNFEHKAYIVQIIDMSNKFTDYFAKIYTEKEYEQLVKEREGIDHSNPN